MLFSTRALLAVAAASVTTALKFGDRVFTVSDFKAICQDKGGSCTYEFGTIYDNGYENRPTKCTGTVLDSLNLPSLPVEKSYCGASSRQFAVDRLMGGHLFLTITQPVTPASNETGVYIIPSFDIKYDKVNGEYYTGPTEFNATSLLFI